MNYDVPVSPRPLRLAALVKQVPEIESLTLGRDGRLQRSGVELRMNDYCRRAVALGKRLAEESAGSLTIITLGPGQAEAVLLEALAYGADDGVLVTDPAFAGSDSLATARTLAASLTLAGPFDAILTGRNSVDSETGQVPPQVAALLDLPFVAGARQVTLADRTLVIGLEHDDEWLDVDVELPLVISCAERLCDPCKVKDPAHLATADRQQIRRITASELGLGPWGQRASPTTVGSVRELTRPRARRVIESTETSGQVAEIMTVLRGRAALERQSVKHVVDLPVRVNRGGPDVVVVAEPERAGLTAELVGAASELAVKIDGRIVMLSQFGSDAGSGAGVDELVQIEGAEVEEDVASALEQRCRQRAPWAVLGPSTTWGREVLSRASAGIGAGLVADVVALEVIEGRLAAWKPAFGGLLAAQIKYSSQVQMATARAGVFRRPLLGPSSATAITNLRVEPRRRIRLLRRDRIDDLDDLATADRVIGVGAGVEPEAYDHLRELADQIGASLAATRRVTDSGLLPRARQVGITGRSIAPRLFISVGSSGKFNHTLGLRHAGTVVAINTDPSAPIFDSSDVGVVADWHDILPALTKAIGAVDSAARDGRDRNWLRP